MKIFYITILYVLFPFGDLGLDYPHSSRMSTFYITKDIVDGPQQLQLREIDNDPVVGNNQHRLVNRKYKILTYVSSTLLFICIFTGFLFFGKLVKESKKLKKEKELIALEKEQFVEEQIKQYDERILRMLIVNADYEDMKKKLKKKF